jgi:hypothetical protein
MKKVLFICFFITCVTAGNAQDVIASTLKIGPFALDMKLQDVEAITLKKYDIAAVKKSTQEYKPLEAQINGVKFLLTFVENYDNKGNNTNTYKLYRIECSDSKVKTKSGITHGMDRSTLLQLVSKLDIGYTFSKYQEYDKDGNRTKKFNETLNIYDSQAGKTLTMRLKDGKVDSFEIAYEEGC